MESTGQKRQAMSAAERKQKQRKLDQDEPERKSRKLDSLFMFDQVEVSVLTDGNGDIWFKGVDLARALEMDNPHTAICENINEKYIKTYSELTCDELKYRYIPGIHPKTTFVNEMGMNLFIIRSRMPMAESFAEWVCGVVLPSLRKRIGLRFYVDEINEYASKYIPEPESGYFYVATSESLQKEGCLKIGKTKDLAARLTTYNCGRLENDFMGIVVAVKISRNLSQFEKIIKQQTINHVRRGEILNCKIDDVMEKVNCLLETGNLVI